VAGGRLLTLPIVCGHLTEAVLHLSLATRALVGNDLGSQPKVECVHRVKSEVFVRGVEPAP